MNAFPIIILVVMVAVFWFIAVRPAKARQAKQRELINTLKPGQEVMTTAGVFGKVVALEGDIVLLEIAPNVVIRIVKMAVAETKSEGIQDAHAADQMAGIETTPSEEIAVVEEVTAETTTSKTENR